MSLAECEAGPQTCSYPRYRSVTGQNGHPAQHLPASTLQNRPHTAGYRLLLLGLLLLLGGGLPQERVDAIRIGKACKCWLSSLNRNNPEANIFGPCVSKIPQLLHLSVRAHNQNKRPPAFQREPAEAELEKPGRFTLSKRLIITRWDKSPYKA